MFRVYLEKYDLQDKLQLIATNLTHKTEAGAIRHAHHYVNEHGLAPTHQVWVINDETGSRMWGKLNRTDTTLWRVPS